VTYAITERPVLMPPMMVPTLKGSPTVVSMCIAHVDGGFRAGAGCRTHWIESSYTFATARGAACWAAYALNLIVDEVERHPAEHKP